MTGVATLTRRWLSIALLGLSALVLGAAAVSATKFLRGDVANDGVLQVSDPLTILGYLLVENPTRLDCLDAADTNDDGRLDIADAVFLLSHLFLGTEPPPVPFPECAEDPTADELDCEQYTVCTPPIDG